jgi:spermidine synthase
MSPRNRDRPKAALSAALLPVILVLFLASGSAALIYEIVWFQLLELVIGSSAISLSVLLGTFMGGMCLGSITLPYLISPRFHPLKVYAAIEIGIGVLAIAILWLLPYAGGLYTALGGPGPSGIFLRGMVCGALLVPPTMLMGATLPSVARFLEATPRGISWLGILYTGNIAGAVFGCLFAGFYLLRVHDMAVATYAAAAINGAIGMIALAAARAIPYRAARAEPKATLSLRAPVLWAAYLTIALSGLTALGAQVVWTRLLSLILGPSVYTFSIILAVFLVGLGIGSSAGSALARDRNDPRLLLGLSQILLVAAIAWTAVVIGYALPWWPIDPSISSSPWFNFQLDLVRCLIAILPAACLWGASFPLALAAAARREDAGLMVGRVYAANTVGAIFGALGFSLVAIPSIGTQGSQRLLIVLAAIAGSIMLAPILLKSFRRVRSARGPFAGLARIGGALAVALVLGLTVLLVRNLPPIPADTIAHGRHLPAQWELPEILYAGEGINASVAVSRRADGRIAFHVSGKAEASTTESDMRLQRMLGHISALLHPRPKTVLIVGLGAGVTAGSFILHPDVERIIICEIEPLIPQKVAPFFAKENYDVLKDPRVTVVYDDARHYLLTTREKFDVITSDPIHPWVKGAATLYTREYFELAKNHLNPGGIITQWVPLYESSIAVIKTEMATFFGVFRDGAIWANDDNGAGYDVVLFARKEPAPIDVDALQRRLDRPDHARVKGSLAEVGLGSAVELLSTYAGRARDLAGWLKDAPINTDINLRLQYLAGLGLNFYQQDAILTELLTHRRPLDDLFVGTERTKRALREAMERRSKPPEQ